MLSTIFMQMFYTYSVKCALTNVCCPSSLGTQIKISLKKLVNMQRYKDKIALVTGASAGIGAATALKLAENGRGKALFTKYLLFL